MLRNIIGPGFDSRNGVFFCLFFARFSLKSHSPCRKKKIFEKQKKKKKEKTWTRFWLKKRQILDQVLTLQHIYIHIHTHLDLCTVDYITQAHPPAQWLRNYGHSHIHRRAWVAWCLIGCALQVVPLFLKDCGLLCCADNIPFTASCGTSLHCELASCRTGLGMRLPLTQKFRKGVGGQRGLARGNPSHARDSGLFSVPFFLCPLRRRRTHFWRTFLALFGVLFAANPLPPTPFRNLWLTGVKIPQIGERGFRSQKTPISHHPEKGVLSQKTPHFPCSALYRNGDFLTQSALFWGGGKWGFLTPKPSFPDLGDFDPCKGQTHSSELEEMIIT